MMEAVIEFAFVALCGLLVIAIIAAPVGLMAVGIELAERGHYVWAGICFAPVAVLTCWCFGKVTRA